MFHSVVFFLILSHSSFFFKNYILFQKLHSFSSNSENEFEIRFSTLKLVFGFLHSGVFFILFYSVPFYSHSFAFYSYSSLSTFILLTFSFFHVLYSTFRIQFGHPCRAYVLILTSKNTKHSPKRAGWVHSVCRYKFEVHTIPQSRDFAF